MAPVVAAPAVPALPAACCPEVHNNSNNNDNKRSGGSGIEGERRVFCHSPKPEYVLAAQRFYIPARCIVLARPGKDVVVLPGGHQPTLEFVEFCKKQLGLGDAQVVWTSGASYHMDKDMDHAVLADLQRKMAHDGEENEEQGQQWVFAPYCANAPFLKWAGQLTTTGASASASASATDGSVPTTASDNHNHNHNHHDSKAASVWGESEEWIGEFGDKSILHRHIRTPDTPSPIERLNADIRVARGFICSDHSDLVRAWEVMVDEMKIEAVVIKPVKGATGVGIILRATFAQVCEYDFPMGDVALEEFLALDRAPDGSEVSPVLHYVGQQLVGAGMMEQLMDGTEYGGWRSTTTSPAFQRECRRVMQRFLEATQPSGLGGVDFLSVGGEPVLVDINSARFNGGHFPKMFQAMHAPHAAMYCWKSHACEHCHVDDVFAALQAAGLAFEPNSNINGAPAGVFPMLHLRGVCGIYVAFADDLDQVEALYRDADALFASLGAAAPASAVVHA